MTTNRDHGDSTGSSQAQAPYTLVVSAKVTITDTTGTAVEAESISHAVHTIRSRFHDDIPVVVLDPAHRRDPLFEGAPDAWMITPTQLMKVNVDQLPREPDYTLTYHSFTLQDPQADGAPRTPVKSAALVPVAVRAAEEAERPVRLKSKMLGFANRTFQPGDAAALAQSASEESVSVLDALDPELFNTADQAPRTILVHPPEPTRLGNTLIIPAATGVVYNVEPGKYPIEGDCVSVEATPAPGYEFPDAVETIWDYEPEPAREVPEDTGPDLGELVAAEQPHEAAISTAAPEPEPEPELELEADSPSRRRLRRQRSTSKALVLHDGRPLPLWRRRTVQLGAAAAAAVAVIASIAGVLLFSGGDDAPAAPTVAEPTGDWISTAPDAQETGTSLTEEHTIELWSLDPTYAAELSWFGAGVAHIDPEDESLVLLDTLSGEEIARAELDAPVQWTSEFLIAGTPAVGARTEESFIVLTADGETQAWDLEETDSLRVSGSTPMLTTSEGEVYALVVGEEDPVAVSGNPQYRAAAIDGETLIQIAAGQPRVVTLPMTEDAEHDAAELRLETPVDGASFSRHLTVGHGLSLTQWTIQDREYLVVHDLHNNAETTAIVPAASSDPRPWTIGRGMEVAIVGPYAFDLDTGELIAESHAGDFLSALGPALVVQDGDDREFVIDGEIFYETTRVIGFTGGGTILVRQPDGSVAAVEESSGTV